MATTTVSDSPKKPSKTVRFHIKRQDSPQGVPYWEQYEVPYPPSANVISCLLWIAANPVTTDGKRVTPVVWDCNCLEEVCGACTMVINGKVRQSCSALIGNLLKEADDITLEPMTKFPVVRDLMVDRTRMFNALTSIKGWVPIDGTYALGPGPEESPQEQELRYALSRCMTCGCCLEACPQYLIDNDFIGAHAISQARYFNAHPTGEVLNDERLEVLEAPGGVTDCGNAQNCVKVCPKDIPLTESIAAMGRQATVHGIKKFFTK